MSNAPTDTVIDLDDLVKDCKNLRDSLRKRRSDLSTVLSELYSEKSHFIYELLQNAEDAGASWIELHLLPTELIIQHDGRAFDVKDIDGITGISNTDNEKKANQDKIGRFGIGFKSVFKVTNRPRIQSGEFDFEVEDYIVPVIARIDAAYTNTTITLPFSGSEEEVVNTYQAIESKLKKLEAFNLLFLRNLKEFRLSWDEEKRTIRKRGQSGLNEAPASYQLLEDATNDNEPTTQRYLLFQAPVRHVEFQGLKTPQQLALAFLVSDENGLTKLVSAKNDFAFVFFETAHKTSLNFLIHAPFVTTPSREGIKVGLAVNQDLMDELGTLLQQALPYLRKNNLLTVNTLKLLPLERPEKEPNRSLIYKKLFDALKVSLSSEEAFLPIRDERYHQPAARLLLAGSRELTSLLDARKQLETLWPSRSHWIHPAITADAAPTLHAYLRRELAIPEITAAAAVQLFSPAFLSAQSAAWTRKLYGFLGNGRQGGLWQKANAGSYRTAGVLRYQPFMRLRGNKYAAPFGADDKLQVFLPLDDGQLEGKGNCLDPATIESKVALAFVKQLGIKKPDLLDEIRLHILPLYSRNDGYIPPKKQALQHFRHIAAAYALGGEKRAELVKLLRDPKVRFVQSIFQDSNKVAFSSYQEACLPDNLLHQYFQHFTNIRFVDVEFYKSSKVKDWQSILKTVGFRHDQPWVLSFDPKFSEEYEQKLRGTHSRRTTKTLDYRLNGLDALLSAKPFTPELSVLAWEILVRAVHQIKDLNAFYGQHSWFYGHERFSAFHSNLRKRLENTPWLYTAGGEGEKMWRPLTDVVFEELPDIYAKGSEGALYLLQNLSWKTSARAHLEKQMLPDEKSEWDAFKQAKAEGIDIKAAIQAERAKQQLQREQEKKRLEQAPPLNVNNFTERTFKPTPSSPAEIGERQKGANEVDDDSSGPINDIKPGPTLRKGIGERGEEVVWKRLQKEYNDDASLTLVELGPTYALYRNAISEMQYELAHGNTKTTTSEGCDFTVKRNGEIIRYIEVKATSETGKTAFEVSERQWRVASTLCDEGNGEQYEIWFIHAALTARPTYTTIRNPVARWRNGELGVAPVRIEV